jgi:hypothetical protein
MVLLLGVSFVLVMIIYVALEIRDGMAAIEAKNQKSRRALAALTAYKAQAKSTVSPDAPKIPDQALSLQSYLFAAGERAKVNVPGVNQRGSTTKGKFTSHAASVELREVTLSQVKDFLEAIESESKVVVVSALQIRRNFRDKEKLDLTVDVVTWSNAAAANGDGKGGDGKGTGGGTAKAGG